MSETKVTIMTNQHQIRSERQSGYTIIEVMIVVAILGIISVFAVPQFRNMLSGGRVRTTTDSLLHDLLLVKAIARERGGGVVICKSDNPEATTPACSNVVSNASSNTGWAGGWIAFKDANSDGQFNPGDDLLFVQPATMRTFNEGSVVPTPNNTVALTFNATGQNMGGAVQFYVKGNDPDTTRDRYVCVGIGGRILVSKTAACN
ncbi:GspH/FimT family pseudopilin [Undibacterium sp. TC4M20W]|uniref:GspH/FimT family pseudopilin n=1 Tax=Undibacterium sp. TC4M20W TaxID=3413052 RepID=UPI003BF5EC05